jgi:hypothetical protein
MSSLMNKLAMYVAAIGQSNIWTHPARRSSGPSYTVGKASRDKKKKRKAQRVARRLNR